MPTRAGRSLTAYADEQVSILSALRMIGADLLASVAYGRNAKIHCPFGEVHHVDGGIEPAMRVYPDSNHAYCFAGCGSFGPVRLVAHAFDLTRRTAAVELLDRAGLRRPARSSVWHDTDQVVPPDTTRLAEALTTFCRRSVPDWATRQFDPELATRLTRCLSLLDHVRTDEQAVRWLTACKTIMTRAAPPAPVDP